MVEIALLIIVLLIILAVIYNVIKRKKAAVAVKMLIIVLFAGTMIFGFGKNAFATNYSYNLAGHRFRRQCRSRMRPFCQLFLQPMVYGQYNSSAYAPGQTIVVTTSGSLNMQNSQINYNILSIPNMGVDAFGNTGALYTAANNDPGPQLSFGGNGSAALTALPRSAITILISTILLLWQNNGSNVFSAGFPTSYAFTVASSGATINAGSLNVAANGTTSISWTSTFPSVSNNNYCSVTQNGVPLQAVALSLLRCTHTVQQEQAMANLKAFSVGS